MREKLPATYGDYCAQGAREALLRRLRAHIEQARRRTRPFDRERDQKDSVR